MDMLREMSLRLRLLIDYVIDFLFGLYYYDSKRKYIPDSKNPLILESATALANKIRRREVKCEDVVRAFVDRIEQVNGVLNAIVDDRFDEALREARQIDECISNGKITQEDFAKRPFLGVPFTTKESCACKGMKWSLGLICRKHVIADKHATVIDLMIQAGAILIGVSNIPQLNRWVETYNPVYGVCNNPYNTTRNAGGSSGGEGSIIAAGGSPIGIGTDLAGSARIPALNCGIFGHKCTGDLTASYGLSYSKENEGPTITVSGPMSRHSEDLLPVLKILVGANVDKLHLDENVDVKRLNVFYMASIRCAFLSPVGKDISGSLTRAVKYFNETCETKVTEVHFEKSKYVLRLWSYMASLHNENMKENLTNRRGEVSVAQEIIKFICGRSEYNLYIIFSLLKGFRFSCSPEWAKETLDELKTEICNTLGDNGVLLCPSYPYTARHHYSAILRPYNLGYCALWNALKFPATQVPLGLSSEGLPVGIQVVAPPYQDHLCLAVARELEKAFGGHVPPYSIKT